MKKVLRSIAIVLSILIIVADIAVYIKLHDTINNFSEDSLSNLGLLISSGFYFGEVLAGIILVVIIWSEYFLLLLAIKILNKYTGRKRIVLFLLVAILILLLLFNGGVLMISFVIMLSL